MIPITLRFQPQKSTIAKFLFSSPSHMQSQRIENTRSRHHILSSIPSFGILDQAISLYWLISHSWLICLGKLHYHLHILLAADVPSTSGNLLLCYLSLPFNCTGKTNTYLTSPLIQYLPTSLSSHCSYWSELFAQPNHLPYNLYPRIATVLHCRSNRDESKTQDGDIISSWSFRVIIGL